METYCFRWEYEKVHPYFYDNVREGANKSLI